VFVRELVLPESDGGIDEYVRAWVRDALSLGFTMDALAEAFRKIEVESRSARAEPLLVIHPDEEFARILAAEIEEAVGAPVSYAGREKAASLLTPDMHVLVTAACASEIVKELRPKHHRIIRLNSVEDVVAGHRRPDSAVLMGVVSRSESILQWSSTLLSALGFSVEDVLLRNPANTGWQDGLAVCDIVAADVIAAVELPANTTPVVFRIVSRDFLEEVRDLVTVQKV